MIEHRSRVWIGGEVDLKTVIEAEAFHIVRFEPPADPVGTLQNKSRFQLASRVQSRETGPNNNYG